MDLVEKEVKTVIIQFSLQLHLLLVDMVVDHVTDRAALVVMEVAVVLTLTLVVVVVLVILHLLVLHKVMLVETVINLVDKNLVVEAVV